MEPTNKGRKGRWCARRPQQIFQMGQSLYLSLSISTDCSIIFLLSYDSFHIRSQITESYPTYVSVDTPLSMLIWIRYWPFRGKRIKFPPCPCLWALTRLGVQSGAGRRRRELTGCYRSDTDGSASFYFGHTGTVLPLYVALGLFNDPQPLTADFWTSSPDRDDRQFRMSRIDPMSANIAFVLFDCARCTYALLLQNFSS